MALQENYEANREGGADRAKDRRIDRGNNVIEFPGADKKKAEGLSKGIDELEKQGLRSTEINAVKQRLDRGEIQAPHEFMMAEGMVKQAALRHAEKELKESVDSDEDNILNYTKGCLKYMQGLKKSEVAAQLKEIQENKPEQIAIKTRVQKLKAQSPRAFKAYVKALKTEKEKGTMTKSREDILKDTETTFAKAIKAPEAVQGEFFKMVEDGKLEEKDYTGTLKALEKEHKAMVAKYEKTLDENEKIFGKKPVKEFKTWLKERKSFDEIRYAQYILETQYIQERKKVQEEFESMPEAITAPHQEKWYNELGYSERKDFLQSLKQLEHQQNNPLAQEYFNQITGLPEEVASKEWSQMMQEFLQHSYEDQETLLKAYRLTEGKQRRDLADRFKALPEETRLTNKNFFSLSKEEKIALLTALEKDQASEDSTEAWQDMMQTETGEGAFKRALHMVTGQTRGQSIVLADILGKKTYEDQMASGKVKAADRQEKNIKQEGDTVAEKVAQVHDLTDDEITISETGQEQEFHTMDLDLLNQGSMELTSIQSIRRELIEDGTVTNDEKDRYSRARFTRRGSERELNLAHDSEQRNNLEDMVKQMLTDALMMAVESMGGRPQRDIEWNDLSQKQSREMLKQYQQMTKQQIGLDGLSTMKKAA